MKNHTSHHESHTSHRAKDTHSLIAAAAEEKVSEVRNRLSGAIDAAKETCASLQKRAVAGAKATDKRVRENPYQAMAIALGLGVLAGFLLSRRSRD